LGKLEKGKGKREVNVQLVFPPKRQNTPATKNSVKILETSTMF
jgi:hypothetical protein